MKYNESLTIIQEKWRLSFLQTAYHHRSLRPGSHFSGSISGRSHHITTLHPTDTQTKESNWHCQRTQWTEDRIHPKYLRPDGAYIGHSQTRSCPAYRHCVLSPLTYKSCPNWKTAYQNRMKCKKRIFRLSVKTLWTKYAAKYRKMYPSLSMLPNWT